MFAMHTHPLLLRFVLWLTVISSCLVSMPLQCFAVSAPSGPKFVLYTATNVGSDVLPPLEDVKGFNVVYVLSAALFHVV